MTLTLTFREALIVRIALDRFAREARELSVDERVSFDSKLGFKRDADDAHSIMGRIKAATHKHEEYEAND